MSVAGGVDPCSAATAAASSKHMSLEFKADFDAKTLAGSVIHTVAVNEDDVAYFFLDFKGQKILGVTNVEDGSQLEFSEEAAGLGSSLKVSLPPTPKGSTVKVKVAFQTSPEASGIQWLAKEQTGCKKQPYLFTQCQAIHARSVVPCQDTPAHKCTYDAAVTVPSALTALMSAHSVGNDAAEGDMTTYRFEQKVAIPTYLVALVIGLLESRDLGPRCRVWSEPDIIEKSAYEFAEVEQMLTHAETLLGPYVWGRYDLLVLPPSFPYGGMENPMLTFVTPTLLAGDRSLVNVVVHEIVHSWTGNLVTSKTWEHFWLNEGFTVFCERKICGMMEGEATRQLESITGLTALQNSVDQFGAESPFTALCPKFDGQTDPDDAFSSVPYEKGSNFLYYIESLVGGAEVMNEFLKAYIQKFAHMSITTQDFQQFVETYFADKKEALAKIDWNAWYTTPGMPIIANKFDDSLAVEAKSLATRILSSDDFAWLTAAAFTTFSALQMQLFLDVLIDGKPTVAMIDALQAVYDFNNATNAEIRFRWQRLCLKAGDSRIFPAVAAFVVEQGRMKFVRPLYRDLFKTAGGKDLAVATFTQNRYDEAHSTLVLGQLATDRKQGRNINTAQH
eukprot:m.32349 g.32349  ORF g.32349 m.32349 type:complete len:617 (-) comp9510_c0_seq1:1182-3032(-)